MEPESIEFIAKNLSPAPPEYDPNLSKILTALSEIGSRINQLGANHNLPATLRLIVENAVAAVSLEAASDTIAAKAAAVIWIYDEAFQTFDPASRVSVGEVEQTSLDDFPRRNGLGMRAIRCRRRQISYEVTGFSIHPAKQKIGARSVVCYPLIVGDEAVGVLYVYRRDERHFSTVELLALDNFVNLAAMAIYHGWQSSKMSQALERKESELEKLGLASRLISSRANLDETLDNILAIGLDITGAQYGSFRLHDKKKGVLTPMAMAGRKQGAAAPSPLPVDEKSVVGWVATRQHSLLIPDLHDPHWQSIYHPLPTDEEMRSELAAPLLGAGGRLEGVLNIESPQPNAFTEEDQHLLEALATQAVIALQEIRLLDAMREITEVLLTQTSDELFTAIIERACDLINVPVGSIWTISEHNTLILRQSTAGYRRGRQLPLDGSFTGRAIRMRRPITVDNVQNDPDFQHREFAHRYGWMSAIVVPLLTPDGGGRALGSFSLYSTTLRDFSNWDKKLLITLANYAAAAIQVEALAKQNALHFFPKDLSEREQEVFSLLIQGQTNKQIGATLNVSVNTVKKHLQNIFTKLNVETRAAAVGKALGREL
jgi:GAF domain-containing protein